MRNLIRAIVLSGIVALCGQTLADSQYSVALDQCGGSGGQSSVVATFGEKMPKTPVPKRTGYTFGGYYTKTDGAGTRYYDSNGNSVRNWDRRTNSITLSAYWISNGYTVKLNQNGGSGGVASAYVRYGQSLPHVTPPTRDGYKFGGYYTTTRGVGTCYWDSLGNSAQTWDRATNEATLYAYWIANAYTVLLDQHGGSGGSESASVSYGKSLPHITPSRRTGYTFAGYYVASDGVGDRYWDSLGNSARAWDIDLDSVTLHAYWLSNGYTVKLNQNGGSGGVASAYVRYGKSLPHVEPPTRDGYAFDGYYTTTTGLGVRYWDSLGDSARTWNRPSNSATLYAVWIPKDEVAYTVTLDTLSSAGTITVTAHYGLAMPRVEVPVKAGYVFGGFWTTTRGVGDQYYKADGTANRVWDRVSHKAKFYAYWIPVKAGSNFALGTQYDAYDSDGVKFSFFTINGSQTFVSTESSEIDDGYYPSALSGNALTVQTARYRVLFTRNGDTVTALWQ